MIDPYAPWRETADELSGRHIGREHVLAAIRGAVRAHVDGNRPTDIYVFGPRGTGKSHLLALVRAEIETAAAPAEIPVIWLPEDIPLLPDANSLLARLAERDAGPSWSRWGRAPAPPISLDRAILLLEGLDRQLRHWKKEERRRFRARVRELGVLIIATGVAFRRELTERTAAFHGHFAPWPIRPLDVSESTLLLDAVVHPVVRKDKHWTGRRDALVALAGGSPRTLVALGSSCSQKVDALAAEHLYEVLRAFTAHYQMRFRDLSAQQQRIAELLAEAPREISPTEVSSMLGLSQPAASMGLRALFDLGLVEHREEGRRSWYRLSEDLFRHWLEYRTEVWESTRVGWLGRLLESLLTDDELVSSWLAPGDPELAEPLRQALERRPKARSRAAEQLENRWWEALVAKDEEAVLRWLGAMSKLGEDPTVPASWTAGKLALSQPGVRRILTLMPESAFLLREVLSFSADLLSAATTARHRFDALLKAASAASTHLSDRAARLVLRGALDRLVGRAPEEPPWILTQDQRRRLAAIPHLRVLFLERGRATDDPPLVSPDDVLAAGVGDLVDASGLLAVCHSRRFDTLLEATTRLEPPTWLGLNPSPAREAAHGAAWMAATVARCTDMTWASHWLSWARTWGVSPNQQFGEAVAAIASASGATGHIYLAHNRSKAAETGLLALGLRRPDRFERIMEALQDAEPLAPLCARVSALLPQLRERETARLQPELARLLELLEADSPPG